MLPILDPALLTAAVDRYDLIHVCNSIKHWFVSLFKLKNFLYWIKNPQVEARDPHLPPSLWRDDYHNAGREDDSMSVVGGVFQWLRSLITIIGWTWWSSSMAEDHPRTRMLREQSKNFYIPNIYHFDTYTCKSLVGLLYHKYMLWSKSVVDLHFCKLFCYLNGGCST